MDSSGDFDEIGREEDIQATPPPHTVRTWALCQIPRGALSRATTEEFLSHNPKKKFFNG